MVVCPRLPMPLLRRACLVPAARARGCTLERRQSRPSPAPMRAKPSPQERDALNVAAGAKVRNQHALRGRRVHALHAHRPHREAAERGGGGHELRRGRRVGRAVVGGQTEAAGLPSSATRCGAAAGHASSPFPSLELGGGAELVAAVHVGQRALRLLRAQLHQLQLHGAQALAQHLLRGQQAAGEEVGRLVVQAPEGDAKGCKAAEHTPEMQARLVSTS